MKVKVCVVYPVSFEIDLDNLDLDDDQQIFEAKEKIYDRASRVFECSSIDPVIHECDIPELID